MAYAIVSEVHLCYLFAMRKVILFMAALVFSGCLSAHRVRIESSPPGAIVSIRGKELGATPLELTKVYFPFRWYFYGYRTENFWIGGRMSARLESPGYRTGRIRIGKGAGASVLADTLLIAFPDEFNGLAPWKWKWGHFNRLFGIAPRYTHRVQLIRHHGRAGTWEPEDAQRRH